jgi:hypothetical protein
MSITRERQKRSKDTRVKYPHARSFAVVHHWDFEGPFEFHAMRARLYTRQRLAPMFRRMREDHDE